MSARARFATGVGTLAAGAVYLVMTTTRAGVLFYLPTRGTWTWSPPTGVIAMDWFARSNATLAAAALATWAAWRWAPSDPKRRARWSSRVWALGWTVLAWSAAYTAMWLVSRP
ncbi:MAG: hypothetical protein JWM10_3243 [Myxococcaceae bacterium]|nr:hypothetical protein [Myxococcaceae bacterium]